MLRAKGLPYKRIAARLGVSPGSVYLWTSDIELSAEQRRLNMRGPRGPQNPDVVRRRNAQWVKLCRARRAQAQQEGRDKAHERDPLHMAGCMLYWAEGSKARNVATLANSDRHLVKFFHDFATQCFDLSPDRFTLRLNVYLGNGLSIGEVENKWLEHLGLPRSALRGHTINHMPTSSSGRRVNKLPYGVCTLGITRSTMILQHIYGAIQGYGGFEEPHWLDGPPRKLQAAAASRSAS